MAAQARTDLADASVSVVCLSPVPTGAPFPCAVSVRGLGDAPPPMLVELDLPVAILHVAHDAGGRFDADARTVTFPVAASPEAPRAFRVDLIADDAAAGTVPAIAASLRVDGPRQNAERHGAASVVLERRFEVDLGYTVLPIRPLWVFAAMVLAVPLCLGLVWIARRGRRREARRRSGYRPVPRDTVFGPVFLCVLCLLALSTLSPALIESVRSLTTFAETRCTLLDRTRSGSPSGDEKDWASMAVLRYPTPAGPRLSLGFDVRGTLVRSGNAEAYRSFAVGRDHSCWFDPQRPDRVVLRRGPSAAALLALVPALALLALLPALRRAWLA